MKRYSDRWVVEDCKTITTQFLHQYDFYEGGVNSGIVNWSRLGKETGSVGVEVSTISGREYVRFYYTYTDYHTDEKIELDYKVKLVSTACHFGGKRWWFICPLIVDGKECLRRVGALYLKGKYFGCRHCHDLTYTSCRESHKPHKPLISPEVLEKAFEWLRKNKMG